MSSGSLQICADFAQTTCCRHNQFLCNRVFQNWVQFGLTRHCTKVTLFTCCLITKYFVRSDEIPTNLILRCPTPKRGSLGASRKHGQNRLLSVTAPSVTFGVLILGWALRRSRAESARNNVIFQDLILVKCKQLYKPEMSVFWHHLGLGNQKVNGPIRFLQMT